MSVLIGTVAGFFLLAVLLFAALFLGGLCSAALEARRERKAGLPVSRPAWDQRAARKAAGGRRAYLRGLWRGLREAATDARFVPGNCTVCGAPEYDDQGEARCVGLDSFALDSVRAHDRHDQAVAEGIA